MILSLIVYVERINIHFHNIAFDDFRRKRIAALTLDILDRKLKRMQYGDSETTVKGAKPFAKEIGRISAKAVRVSEEMNDYEIASNCASMAYQAIAVELG